jgi:hypothetical protein
VGRGGACGDPSSERRPLLLGQRDSVLLVHPGAWRIPAAEPVGAGVTMLTAPERAGALCWSHAPRAART